MSATETSVKSEAQTKQDVVESLRERLSRASIAILAEPRGLNVAQVTKLRRKIRGVSGEYKVAKNTLTRRAVDETSFKPLLPLLKGPTALVFGYGDPIVLAKEVVDYANQNTRHIQIKGALLDGQLFEREQVEKLARLQGKDQLRAQLLGLLQAPAARLVRIINEPGAALARVLAARVDAGAPGDSPEGGEAAPE